MALTRKQKVAVCRKKKTYNSKLVADSYAEDHEETMKAYRCEVCDMWHLTTVRVRFWPSQRNPYLRGLI